MAEVKGYIEHHPHTGASATLLLGKHTVRLRLQEDGHFELWEHIDGQPDSIRPKFEAELLAPRKHVNL